MCLARISHGSFSRGQIELAFLDAVFHLAVGAVDHLVEILAVALFFLQRGDDEARVGFIAGPLRLADHAPLTAPTIKRTPAEIQKDAGWSAAGFAHFARNREFIGNLRLQPSVGQPRSARVYPGATVDGRFSAVPGGTGGDAGARPRRHQLRCGKNAVAGAPGEPSRQVGPELHPYLPAASVGTTDPRAYLELITGTGLTQETQGIPA
jgi:hypothetical protein